MFQLLCSILILCGSQRLLTYADHSVDLKSENGQELLLCRKCGADVADSYYLFSHLSPGARRTENRDLFGKNNVTVQTLVNPFGDVFEIVTTEKARCDNIGLPQGADSWFPGFEWQVCTCAHCGQHLGWTFERSIQENTIKPKDDKLKNNPIKTFHGLILSNILGENFVDSLMFPNMYRM